MRSLRIDPELDALLEQAAAVRGESVSEFIRRAAAERASSTLRADLPAGFDDVLGVVRGGGGRARDTGAAFAESLARAADRR